MPKRNIFETVRKLTDRPRIEGADYRECRPAEIKPLGTEQNQYWQDAKYWKVVEITERTANLSRQDAIKKVDASPTYAIERAEREGKDLYDWKSFWVAYGDLDADKRKSKISDIEKNNIMVSF